MASKYLAQSFYSQSIQSNMTTSSTSTTVDVAPANSVGYAVLETGESNQEIVKWQALAGTTLSSMLRGLSLSATSDTEVSGLKKTHAINSSIAINNVHYIINDKISNAAEETVAGLKTFTLAPKSSAAAAAATELMRYGETVRLTGAQTIAGVKTLSSIPVGPASDPTTDNQFARKAYVDSRPAAIVSFTTYYVGEAITDRNALSREDLTNTDGGSDAHIGRDAASNGVYQAQSFIAGSTASSFGMTVSLKKVGAPTDNLYIEIQGDSGGSPDGTPVTNGTSNDFAAAGVGAGYDDETFVWAADPVLVAGTRYWAVIKRDGANSDAAYYVAEYASNNALRCGAMKKYTSTWTTNTGANDDMVFAITGVSDVAVKSINTSANSSRGRLGFLGFANAAASVGATVEIQTHGRMTGFTSLTANTAYSVHTGAGALSTTLTDPIVGITINTTTLMVNRARVNSEMETFFAATDISGAEAETLTDESNADGLHVHDPVQNELTAQRSFWPAAGNAGIATGGTVTDFGGSLSLMTNALNNAIGEFKGVILGSVHDKNPKFLYSVAFAAATAQDGFIGVTISSLGGTTVENEAMTADHFGFVIQDGTVKYSVANGATQSKGADLGLTVTDTIEYAATFDGTTATFYINGSSVGTLTGANVPDGALANSGAWVIADVSAAAKTMYVNKTGGFSADK